MSDMAYEPHQDLGVYAEPERTSLSAVLGFLFSLGGCCFGVTALLGLPLSIIAMVSIGRSRGRLGGRGLAVAGMILGLMNLALWGSCLGGVVMSAGQAETVIMQPTEEVFTLLQQDDFDGVRARLGAPGANATDAELIAFREAYRSTLGDFVARPSSLMEYVNSMMRMGPWQPVLSNPGQQQIPLLATFEHGEALILITPEQASGRPSALRVYDSNLNEYALPFQTPAPTADTTPGPGDAGDAQPGPEPGSEPGSEPGVEPGPAP